MSVNYDSGWIKEAWGRIVNKVEWTSERIKDSFPHVSINGKYNDETANWWTNGFWPGILWMLYSQTKNENFKALAEQCEVKLDGVLADYDQIHHDVGFMWMTSAVANFRFQGNETSRNRGLLAAAHLTGRYNAAGQFIRAWNNEGAEGWAIIDCMMNLSLLYWASETTGDPRFRHIAVRHADTTLEQFIRSDGSVHHIVCFDPETGARTGAQAGQGYAADSAWSRGSAWAIYGMAISYRCTNEVKYLEGAKQTAQYFVSQLNDDWIPVWDFRAPEEGRFALDTSAAACAACGMLEIAEHCDPEEAERYKQIGMTILRSLYENYCNWSRDKEAMVAMGTVNFNRNRYINTPIIYADFFFIEGILRLMGGFLPLWHFEPKPSPS